MSKTSQKPAPSSADLERLIEAAQAECDELCRAQAQAEADASHFVATDAVKYEEARAKVAELGPKVAAAAQRVSHLRLAHREAVSRERDQEIIQLRYDTWEAHKRMRDRYNEMAAEKAEAKKRYEELCRAFDREDSELHLSASRMRDRLHELLLQRGLDPGSHEAIHGDPPPPMDRVALR